MLPGHVSGPPAWTPLSVPSCVSTPLLFGCAHRSWELIRALRRHNLPLLGAAVAQWSLVGAGSPLVSVPTGVGKTAIALASPFLAGARRTLVVVPSQELRRQTVAHFRSQDTLREIGALEMPADAGPVVVEAGETRTGHGSTRLMSAV